MLGGRLKVIRGERGNLGERSRFPNKEILILSQRHQFFLLGRSFTLVTSGEELVKTFRLGDEEGFLSRIGRILVVLVGWR